MNWRDFAPEYVRALQEQARIAAVVARVGLLNSDPPGYVAKLQRESARVSAAARLGLGVDRRPSAFARIGWAENHEARRPR